MVILYLYFPAQHTVSRGEEDALFVYVSGRCVVVRARTEQEPQTLTLTPSSRNKVVVGELVSN